MKDLSSLVGFPTEAEKLKAYEYGQEAGVTMPNAFMMCASSITAFEDLIADLLYLQSIAPDDDRTSICSGSKGGRREIYEVTHRILEEYFKDDTFPEKFCEELSEEISETLNDLMPPSSEEVALASRLPTPAPKAILRFASTTREWLRIVGWLRTAAGENCNLAD